MNKVSFFETNLYKEFQTKKIRMITKNVGNPLEELCVRYIPSRYLGDFLPAHITVEIVRNYAKYLSRLNDSETYGHLRHLGISKKRAEGFIIERKKLRR